MTSDDLLRTIRAQIDAHFSAAPPVDPPAPPPVQPPVQPPSQPPAGPVVVMPGNDYSGGNVVPVDAALGVVYAFPYSVPTLGAQVGHMCLAQSSGFHSVRRMRMWESVIPGGTAIQGSEYTGSWNADVMDNGFTPVAPGGYHFNVRIDECQDGATVTRFGVKLRHN